jgi:cardiolipin synthase
MLIFSARDIPNIISVLRIALTIPVMLFLLQREYTLALALFAVAGFSDALDGFLAKHFGWQSRLGGLLDPLADKVLLMTAFLVLGATGLIPIWLVVIALCRDLVIVGGAFYYNFAVEEVLPAPSLVSKLNTLLQILLVILVTMDAGPLPLPDALLAGLQWALLATIVFSGVHYVFVWTRKAAAKGWKD